VEKYCKAGQARDDNMAHAHCMLNTNTHCEYKKRTVFPLQQWLHEFSLILRYMYISVLVISCTRRLWFQKEIAETQFFRKM
jgi:hypothetical protein